MQVLGKVNYEILLHFFNSFFVLSHFTWPFMVFDVFSTFQLFRYYCFSFSFLYLLPWPGQTFFFPLSLSSILTVPSRPLRIYSSFSSSQKKKKTHALVLYFLSGALKFLGSGSTQKNIIKKSSGSFL